MSADDDGLTEQPVPSDSKCPDCGGDPLPESVVHNLSAMGYRHDDIKNVCEDCGSEWYCGVPIGGPDPDEMGADLRCESCDDAWMLVHRSSKKSAYTEYHLKCPNPNCYYFKRIQRENDSSGVSLVGYPQITGNMDGCRPYGYPRQD